MKGGEAFQEKEPLRGSTGGAKSLFPGGGLPLSGWTLIGSNLLPLAGVLFWGWDAFTILFLFWMENVILGILNFFRLLLAGGGDRGERAGRFFLAPFFLVHYGIFTLVHGVFILVLCGPDSPFLGGGGRGPDPFELPAAAGALLERSGLLLSLAVLAGSHVLSFFRDYIGEGEYKTARPGELMIRPYGRIVVLHLAILGGGFLAALSGSPVWMLTLLVLLKIGLDLKGYLKERLHLALREDSHQG